MNLKEILHQIQTADSETAFRRLFDTQYERMFRVAYYFVQCDEWAKEVVLDVLSEIWIRRKTMVMPDDFRHYSFVMVKNAALNLMKREGRHKACHEEVAAADTEALAKESPEELLEQSELFESYERLLMELPERCREVFCRVKEDGATYAEVAAEMGISVKTVDAQLQKALKHLRERLMPYRQSHSGKRFFLLFL